MDVLLDLTEDGPELLIQDGDLAIDRGLSSAVLLSIFVDRRATADDLIPPEEDPRGWPLEPADDRWGSKFWLLERAKATTENLALARASALEALAWLVEDEIAESVDVRVELAERERLYVEIDVVRGKARRWPQVWESVKRGETVREVAGASFRVLYR
jgi:phage gp46-like protein